MAQDLEPEYIAVSHDSPTAWVTLQENNALGIIDLKERRVTSLVGLGFKDHTWPASGSTAGATTERSGFSPGRSSACTTRMASRRSGIRATTYLVTANEGDVREYPGINAAGTEVVEIEDIALDSTVFPAALAATMKSRPNGHRPAEGTAFDGDTDGDGDYDELYSFGGRSFSIWSSDGSLVFDSGDSSSGSPPRVPEQLQRQQHEQHP